MRQVGRRAAESRSAKNGTQLAPLPATIARVDVSSCDDRVSQTLQVFASTVGKKPSAAANYVNDVDEVHELLASLVKVTTRESVQSAHDGFYSVLDLKSMAPNVSSSMTAPLKPVLSMHDLKTESGDDFEVSNLAQFLGMATLEDGQEEEEDDMFF